MHFYTSFSAPKKNHYFYTVPEIKGVEELLINKQSLLLRLY